MNIYILRNLWNGARLLCFDNLGLRAFRPSICSVVVNLLLALFVGGSFDYLRQEGPIYFSAYGVALVIALSLFVALIVVFICWHKHSIEKLPMALTAASSAAPWYVFLLYTCTHFLDGVSWFYYLWYLVIGLGVLCLCRVLRFVVGPMTQRDYGAITFVFMLLVVMNHHLYLSFEMFYSYDPDEYSKYDDIDQEAVFYAQSRLVQKKLSALNAETEGEPDMYFVGFAGNGDEEIFHREVTFVKDVVDEKYHSKGRSMIFSNQLSALDSEPLANTYNLANALSGVGKKINSEEDVVFVFLSSHGSKTPYIDISLYPFTLSGLTPELLKQYLDDAGIRRRIVIISACYSGAFIEALSDENTLIITAASATRTSFGCSDERDLTYFGEMFFKDEVLKDNNLITAFERARVAIKARETAEEKRPSDPQIAIGKQIEAYLREHWFTNEQQLTPPNNLQVEGTK